MRSHRRRLAVVSALALLLVACGSDAPLDAASTTDPAVATAVASPAVASPEPVVPTSTAAESELDEPAVDEAAAAPSVVYGDRFPEVLSVEASDQGDGRWRFSVTLSSPYDTPERYADAWRVLDAQGNELGVRVLTHDHANEQPFTRSHEIEVPAGTTVVFVEGRDQLNGWSGQRFAFDLPM